MIKEDLVNPWNQFNNNYKENGKETMIWTLEKMYRYLNIMRDWTELIKKIYSFPLKHTEMLDKKKKTIRILCTDLKNRKRKINYQIDYHGTAVLVPK